MDQDNTRPLLEEAAAIARSVADHLAYLGELGLAGLDRGLLRQASRNARDTDGDGRQNPADALREVRDDLGDCTRCPLHQGRQNVVFGVGDPYARVMFVGEGPGADEDAQGIPFVGKAGKLLTDVVEKGMRLERSEVYIANVVKCRPPGNRDPLPEEQETCMPFLAKQIEAIAPRAIVALGKVAANALLGVDAPISRLRGDWSEYNGVAVMPTFHPSYLLRNPREKAKTWEDIKKVMEKLGIPVEEKK